MLVTKTQTFEIDYYKYKIEIYQPFKTFAYFITKDDFELAEGGFTTAKSALLAAKKFIDGDE